MALHLQNLINRRMRSYGSEKAQHVLRAHTDPDRITIRSLISTYVAHISLAKLNEDIGNYFREIEHQYVAEDLFEQQFYQVGAKQVVYEFSASNYRDHIRLSSLIPEYPLDRDVSMDYVTHEFDMGRWMWLIPEQSILNYEIF